MKFTFFKAAFVTLTLSLSHLASAAIIPIGIQNNTEINSILNDGWSYLYRENTGVTSNIHSVFGGLGVDDWIIVAGIRNSDDVVLAHAATTWGNFSTQTSLNQTHTFNGVDWYFNGNSMGFTAIGDSIKQTSADTSPFIKGNQGLSIHTNYTDNSDGKGPIPVVQSPGVSPTWFGSGYRMGSVTVGNGQSAYDWAFFRIIAEPVNSPSTLAIFALGILVLAVRRFKK